MTLFDQIVFKAHPAGMGGTMGRITFPNGYGASVITGEMFYTDAEHPYELAVISPSGELDYTTPITDDVLGHLDRSEVEGVLEQIQALPIKN